MDCFAEPVIGLAEGETQWLAMTAWHRISCFEKSNQPDETLMPAIKAEAEKSGQVRLNK